MKRRWQKALPWVATAALFASACEDRAGFGTVPTIRVVPTVVSFGSIAVGSEELQEVTVTNIGGGTLTVSSIELTPTSSADFSVEPVALPKKLTSRQSFKFKVFYRPQDVAADTGRILVKSDDRAKPTETIELRTLEIGPKLVVEPDSLDFGVVERGRTTTLDATIRNEGFADLIIENITTLQGSDFGIVAPSPLPFTLAPANRTTLTVSYTPTGCSPDDEVLQIFSNDGSQNPFLFPVRGQPPGPAIGATPTGVNFGAVNIGQSVTQTVSLKNIGTTDLHVSSIFMGIGSDMAFSIQAPTTPATLAANQTLDVQVTFRAATAGFARGALVASSDDCDKPQFQVPLEAIGTEGPAPLIQVSPSTLNYGNVASGATADRSFTVTSIGQLPLMVSGIAPQQGTSGEFTVAGGGGAFQLAGCSSSPCPSQTVTVRYAPTNQGSDAGAVIVSSNAANDPAARVNLQANGTQGATCVMRATPPNLNFQDVAIGAFRDLPVTLTNSGTGNCTYDNAVLSPFANLGGYRVQSQPGRGSVIGPGQSRQVVVRLQPPMLNDLLVAFLTVSWNDPNPGGAAGTAIITLIGRSVEARIAVVPARLDFGLITVGCASPVTTVRVFNAGSAPLQLNAIRLETSPSRFQIVQAPPAGTQVPGGQSVEVKVRYVPTAVGTDMNTLIIESTDRGQPSLRVPLVGQGTNIVDVLDKFIQPRDPKVDILFVVDNSGSMSEEQNNLATNFRNFAQFAQTLNVDYQIGVVTTDSGKLKGTPKIIRSADADPVAEFGRNANVGSNGSGTEQGLEFAYQALTEPLVSGDNAGFLRADASLEIIAVSDEEDQSPGSVDFYTTFFYSIKGARNTNLFHFSAIAGDVPNGCTSNNGDGEAGRRYKEVADRTQGVFGSICDPSFANTLRAIGNRAFGQRTQFFLSRQPDLTQPFTVRQYTNEAACDADTAYTGGTVVAQNPNTGYTYDAASNSIIFSAAAVPPRAACLKVKYKAACLPP
jgi:hypothetical protein